MGRNIKKLLTEYGLAYIFDNPNVIDQDTFLNEFKTRIIDTFKQETMSKIENSSMLNLYKYCKQSHYYEPYLDILSKSNRFFMSKL